MLPPPLSQIKETPINEESTWTNNGIYNNGRLAVFDALRGFSMLSVVFVHSLSTIGVETSSTIIGTFVESYFLPLFFFISGFFAFKPFEKWTITTYKNRLIQKTKSLLICSLVFYTIRYYAIGMNPFGWWENGFMGYWFTIVLFDMFIIYYLVTSVSQIIKKDVSLFVMIVLALIGPILIQLGYISNNRFCTIFGITNLYLYLQWFVFGLLAMKYKEKFISIISNEYCKAILIVAYIVVMCDFHHAIPNLVVVSFIDTIFVHYIGILTIVALFYNAKTYFDGNSLTARSICYTGRRSLDLYMLHYFFLPVFPAIGLWLSPNSMILFQLIIGGCIVIAITAICLFLSDCIRSSRFLANWLLGVKHINCNITRE